MSSLLFVEACIESILFVCLTTYLWLLTAQPVSLGRKQERDDREEKRRGPVEAAKRRAPLDE
jgi:hypothetical protein